jgi:BASS family bile acid:Na+ symporter
MLRHLLLFLIQNLVFAMLLSMGLRTTVADLQRASARRGFIVRTALVTNLAVPLLAIVLVAILPVGPLARGLILLFAICPGAPFILLKYKDDSKLASILLVAVSLLAVVTVPLWAGIAGRIYALQFDARPADVLRIVLRAVLLPLLLGVAIRRFLPRLAEPLAKAADIFYKVALAVVLLAVLVKASPSLLKTPARAIFSVMVFTLAATLLGHFAGGPMLADRKLAATFAGLGNPGLVIAILGHSYPQLHAGVAIILYLLVRALSVLPYNVWMKRLMRGTGGTPLPPAAPPAPPPRPAPAAA